MKRKIVLMASLMLALSVKADYLLWQVNQSEGETAVPFAFARLTVKGEGVESGTYLTQAGTDGKTDVVHATFPESENGLATLASYADLGEYANSAYSFAVELYAFEEGSDTASLVGISDYVLYKELRDQFIYTNMSLSGINPFVYGTFRSVPEPTGGLLVLMGLGALALRRKRAVAPEG